MSCGFCYELAVMLLSGRKVTLYIRSCIIKERNLKKSNLLLLSALSYTDTHAFLLYFT